MTLQPSAEKKTCHLQWAVPPPGLQLARCTVLVWSVCSSWGCKLTLSTELWSTNRKKDFWDSEGCTFFAAHSNNTGNYFGFSCLYWNECCCSYLVKCWSEELFLIKVCLSLPFSSCSPLSLSPSSVWLCSTLPWEGKFDWRQVQLKMGNI